MAESTAGKELQPVISFQLPNAGRHVFSPNVPNLATAGPANGPLLLFLPATRAVPSDYKQFLDTASSMGYHVLALDYHNVGLSVVRVCAGNPDCYGTVQRNRFDGSDPSSYSSINPKDSILTRLRSALRYLGTDDPHGDWGRYMTGSAVSWSRIVVAGHSQGGGQSAFIAHEHKVRGAIMFSAPVQSDGGVAATYLRSPSATPPSRLYGLVNQGDMYYRNVIDSWGALGMGTPVETEGLKPDSEAHSLVSDVPLGTPDQSHRFTVTDAGPRDQSGAPAFANTWRWMLKRLA
jgi:pimeloyl-ACP methyl ester carboxylesterase